MAYRRCISLRAGLFARRSIPSFGYFSRENDLESHDKPEEFRSNVVHEYLTTKSTSLGSNVRSGSWRYGSSISREGSRLQVEGGLICMNRYMSTSTKDVATVLSDAPMEAVASQVQAAISEVAIAAADSPFPVAALQYLIDGVHSFTGLSWWASIALTTFLFRGATLPLLIYQHKIQKKFGLAGPPVEFKEVLRVKDPSTCYEILLKMVAPFKEVGITAIMLRPIQVFVSIDFYLAITNMAEHVPSLTNGGAFWFTDLTTPDAMFILPILTSLTFFFPVMRLGGYKLSKKEGRVGYAVVSLFCGVLLSTMNFPQALYIHWIASNVFQTCFEYCMDLPGVMKYLGIPETPGRVRKP